MVQTGTRSRQNSGFFKKEQTKEEWDPAWDEKEGSGL